MSVVEWSEHWPGAYGADVGGVVLFLFRGPAGWWIRDNEGSCAEALIEGGDLPLAEAQRLAVPTLVAALREVVRRLEE